MHKKLIIAVLLVLSVGGIIFLKESISKKEIHFHAGFQVYKDDALLDFSDFKYMKVEPCSTSEHKELSAEEEELEKAHLHDNVGDVVHVHRENVVWGDLFKNIKTEIDSNARAYLNGKETENFLAEPIKAYDSIAIFEGNNTNIEEKLKNSVSKEHVVETESRSENCGN